MRCVVLLRYVPRIQCLQEEGPEGPDSDEEEVDEEELEDDGSLPSVDDLDGTWNIGTLNPSVVLTMKHR